MEIFAANWKLPPRSFLITSKGARLISMAIRPGSYYRRFLPHYRTPGCIYHCRFNLLPTHYFTDQWMFAIVEESILLHNQIDCLIYAYAVMSNHCHVVLKPLPKANDAVSWCDIKKYHR